MLILMEENKQLDNCKRERINLGEDLDCRMWLHINALVFTVSSVSSLLLPVASVF